MPVVKAASAAGESMVASGAVVSTVNPNSYGGSAWLPAKNTSKEAKGSQVVDGVRVEGSANESAASTKSVNSMIDQGVDNRTANVCAGARTAGLPPHTYNLFECVPGRACILHAVAEQSM